MTIKPIRSEADHANALREIERLWNARAATPKGDRLDVLLSLVETYERAHYQIGPPDPLDAIQFRLEQSGLVPAALVGIIGSRTRVYEVLRGDRALTLPMIRRVHEKLGVPADVLIRPHAKKRRRAA